jgi:hypothetical protein
VLPSKFREPRIAALQARFLLQRATSERFGANSGSRNERSEAAGALAEAVIRSVELIVQPEANDVVGETGVGVGLPPGHRGNCQYGHSITSDERGLTEGSSGSRLGSAMTRNPPCHG